MSIAKPLTELEAQHVRETVENEGFDYCFHNYSSFDEIKNKRFHELRLKFLAARAKLAEYIGID